ncbi:MAG: Hsp20 family protein [Bacillota bacterium]
MTTLIRRNNLFNLDPFSEMDKFFNRIDSKADVVSAMKTDIIEEEKTYALEIELAGFAKEDIDIKLERGYVKVTAKKAEKDNAIKKAYIRRERFVGTITRSYYVGEGLETTDITAGFENGILKISFPKEVSEKEEAKQSISIG